MKFQQKYNIEEVRAYAREHNTNECAKHFNISYQAMAQLIYRYKLEHKVEQINNYQKNTKLHWIWSAMRQRCENPRNRRYKDYGGRGIYVSEEWKGIYGYINFSQWAIKTVIRKDLLLTA